MSREKPLPVSALDISPEKSSEGAFVSYEEAEKAIAALAAFYGTRRKAQGMSKVTKTPALRREVQGRLALGVDEVAQKMNVAASHDYAAREKALYAPLAKEAELAAVGFDAPDIETASQLGLIALRHKVGVGVNAPQRDAFKRRIQRLGDSSQNKGLKP